MAVQKWKHYLVHLPFTLKTDQFSLKYLWEQKEVPSQYAKWLVKLMGFQFTIEYREGKSNKVADALSRMPQQDSATINDISAITVIDFDTIHNEVDHDPFLRDIVLKLTSNPTAVPPYSLQHGQLFYKNRLVIPKSSSVIPILLSEFHNGAIGEHAGYLKTYKRLTSQFFWVGMKSDIKRCVTNVKFVNRTNCLFYLQQVFCSHYRFQRKFGRIYQWTSSKPSLDRRGQTLFGSLWIDYPSTLTLSH